MIVGHCATYPLVILLAKNSSNQAAKLAPCQRRVQCVRSASATVVAPGSACALQQ